MKKLIVFSILFYHGFTFSQDTTHVKHTQKITKLLDKVQVINEGKLNNKKQVINPIIKGVRGLRSGYII